jgi:hypothetical protein
VSMLWAQDERPDLGSMIEGAIEHAKREWRNEYARGTRVADLMAVHVRRVRVDLRLYPQGHGHLTVIIDASKEYQSDRFFWRLQEVSGEWGTL